MPRPNFPHSVIHGGAYSATELARARRTDTVVAAHYAGFGTNPQFRKLSRNELMYVSYRNGDRVYWSKTRHRIAEGETVISDGNCLARARCGNRLSMMPQSPVAPGKAEPPEEVLNTPETPDEPVSYQLAELPGPAGRPFNFFLPASVPETSGSTGSGAAPGAAAKSVGTAAGPAGGIGGIGAIGGGGLAPVSKDNTKTATSTPGSPSQALTTSTTGGDTLPTSATYPAGGTGGVPTTVEGVVEVSPEPGTLGLLSATLLAVSFLFLLRRSGIMFLGR